MIRPYTKNHSFVGREGEIKEMQKYLDPRAATQGQRQQNVFALIGLGGMGKTQTALAYVFESWEKFQAILWAQADTPTKLSQSFADFAYDMGLVSDRSDQEGAVGEAKRWFEKAGVCIVCGFCFTLPATKPAPPEPTTRLSFRIAGWVLH